MTSNVINEIGIDTSIEETMNQRIEYGGIIKDNSIIVRFTGGKRCNRNYNYDSIEINYHTHPYQVNKWKFALHQKQISFLNEKKTEKGVILKSEVAASEGIYFYSLSDELFTQLITNRDEIDFDSLRTILQDLKLLLGYARSISVNRKKKKLETSEIKNDSIKKEVYLEELLNYQKVQRVLFYTSELAKFTMIESKITLDKYLNTIRLMGFIMELIPYNTYQVNLYVNA